jgi:hypothetical protein
MSTDRVVLPYIESTWFAVPLRNEGFAVGVVARMKADLKGGIALGYFFGPRLDTLPGLPYVNWLQAEDALLVCRFGDGGLFEGAWPIIGPATIWVREHWPMPAVLRTNPLNGTLSKVMYSEADIQKVIAETPASREDGSSLPRDGLFGAGAVEIVLTKAIEGTQFRKR